MDNDRRLRDLLGPPKRDVDRAFVASVAQSVRLEQKLQAARRRTWWKFAREVIASLAVLLVTWTLASMDSNQLFAGLRLALSPATIALGIFALWAAVVLRPASPSAL